MSELTQMAVLSVVGWLGVAYIVLAVVDERSRELGYWTNRR